MKLLITGACGFIGSNATKYFLEQDYEIGLVVDKCTYAADPKRVTDLGLRLSRLDIARMPWHYVLEIEKPDVIINFAASTHVDNSIEDASEFVHSNYKGVHNLLVGLRRYIDKIKHVPLLIHISTDEVYGDMAIGSRNEFVEIDPLAPNNPYSATKAAADLLIQAMHHTYKDFQYVICRPSNNYGPNQHMEKFLPTIIRSVLNNKQIPVYGRGKNVREWLWSEDLARGLDLIIKHWQNRSCLINSVYNFGSAVAYSNIDVVYKVLSIMDAPVDFISYVSDRPGHDRQYRLNCGRALSKLNWHSTKKFEEGLEIVVDDIKSRIT